MPTAKHRPAEGTPVDDLETPRVVVDLDTMEGNLHAYREIADATGVTLRSHVKTHKNPTIARRQDRFFGGSGILCQTLSEAEVMAEHGLGDIYLSYMVVEPAKCDRLVTLSETVDRLATTVDGPGNVDPLETAAATAGTTVEVVLEIDIGLGRVGVPSGEPTLALAEYVAEQPHLSIAGVMAYEGHINGEAESVADYERLCAEAMEDVADTVERLEANDIPIAEVKVGSTGTSRYSARHPVVTEINPGMYAFNDANVVERAVPIGPEDCALTVHTTVISRPNADRAIVDAGSKTMSMDLDVAPLGVDRDGVVYANYSEEHGWIDTSAADAAFAVGDRLAFIPPHVCTTVNLHDSFVGARNGQVEEVYEVAARGQVR